MNKLTDQYIKDMTEQGISLSEAPKLMILDNKADRKTIESHVREHFRPISSIYDNDDVDILISLNNSKECLDLGFLTSYARESGKSIYFYSKIDPKNANSFFKNLNYGEEIYIHVKGKDFDEAIERANSRVPLRAPSRLLKEVVSKEIDILDTWYESNGFNCIDFKLGLKKGLHGRPSGTISSYGGELRKTGMIDDDDKRVYISKKGGKMARADSIMEVMFLAAQECSIMTVLSKTKESAESIYKFMKNMNPDE